MNNIESTLREILIDMNVSHGIENISSQDDLFNHGILDSLLLIQFVMATEEKLEIRFKNEDISYDNFKTFENIDKLISKKYKT